MFFGQKHPITIKELFNWSVEVKWSMFWDVGKRHYSEETSFYELVSQMDTKTSNSGAQVTSKLSNEPIKIDDTD